MPYAFYILIFSDKDTHYFADGKTLSVHFAQTNGFIQNFDTVDVCGAST